MRALRVLAIDPFSPRFKDTTLLVGTWGSSAFCSVDDCATWVQLNSLPDIVITLASDGMNLFAGTGSGVFRSTDNGALWTQVNNGITGCFGIYALAIRDTNLFAGSYSGVFHSTNNGTSWVSVSTGLLHVSIPVFHVLEEKGNGTNKQNDV